MVVGRAGRPILPANFRVHTMVVDELWNLNAPLGFQGLRDDIPLRVYYRHMPHWRQLGATYFVTFRLADSLPNFRLRELDQLKSDWEKRNPGVRDKRKLEVLARMIFERIELWLDQGTGCCVLRDERISLLVLNSLHHFHEHRYELGASVVMPNHVHCVIRPYATKKIELEHIIGSWKSFTARRINAMLGQNGKLWQDESYDRIVRDEQHLWRCVQYIGHNPKKANLSNEACRLWINPKWHALGWRFE